MPPPGTVLYARNRDGVTVQWLQFFPEFLKRVLLLNPSDPLPAPALHPW